MVLPFAVNDGERVQLDVLMRTYRRGLVRKAQALKVAVERKIRFIDLAANMPATLAPSDRKPRQTLDHARGLLATKDVPPQDDQIADWLAERRLRQYDS